MIRINNLEEEKTQEILLDLGFFKREHNIKGNKYNIWVKEIILDDEEVNCSFLINTAYVNDNCLRIYVGTDGEFYDGIDTVSTDDELDFLMQMFNSGLSIEKVKYVSREESK